MTVFVVSSVSQLVDIMEIKKKILTKKPYNEKMIHIKQTVNVKNKTYAYSYKYIQTILSKANSLSM